MTDESDASEWVQREVTLADRERIPAFPLWLDGDFHASENWAIYVRTQYADVRGGALPNDDFYDRLARHAPRKPVSAGADVTAPPPSPPVPLPKGEGRKPASAPPLQLPDLSAILPPPFEWCLIPAGQVTLEEGGYVPEGGQTFDVPAFAMAKYPITNAQFDVFARAKDGYRDAMWWDYSDEAKAWRKQNAKPKAPGFGGVGDHPRADVTWYEAAVFCRWLNWKALTLNSSLFDGEGRRGGDVITLPTEQQWQRAAQGDDGREYPWGSTFDAKRCNTSEGDIGRTTRVTAYPDGASPYGVVDMAGNVWEWCLTDYDTGADDVNKSAKRRVLRGGSFINEQFSAAASSRGRNFPLNRNDSYGLRVVLCAPKRL
ncbi:MAG: hypothetical protein DWB42_02770 [Chloroflexi bacterium]|nr:hypothetical protein [Chloroflexota bacterium]